MPDGSGKPIRYEAAPSWAVAAAPILGLGAFLLLGGRSGGEELTEAAAALSVWQLLLASQVVVWTVLAGMGLRGLGRLDAHLRAWWPEDFLESKGRWWRPRQTAVFLAPVYGALVLMFLMGWAGNIVNPPLFPGHHWKVVLLHVVAGAAAGPFLVSLRWVQLSAAEEAGWWTTARDIAHIRSLRRSLRSATAALGVIVALAVVSTGANRQAVLAAGQLAFPQSLVVMYGGWFTGVLAAVYLYVFSTLDWRARHVMDGAVRLPDPDPAAVEAFAARTELRAALADELELGGDPRKNLEGLVAVFSPLVAGLVSQVGGL